MILEVTMCLLLQAQPAWLALARQDTDAVPASTEPKWTARADGLETAQIEASLAGTRADVIHLVRADPRAVRFTVRNAPDKPLTADAWRDALGALAVVNGSYYRLDNTPDTPVKSDGARLGPKNYASSHGAFVVKDGEARIVDLAGKSVDAELAPFPNALVSYPLLIDPSGKLRAGGSANWLANRTFVGIDGKGRVILGTTETGFFSLRRLARFLQAAPLDLKAALNLDGGPVACQSVRAGAYEKTIYGAWELNDSSGAETAYWNEENSPRWPLPLVLAVLPKAQRAR